MSLALSWVSNSRVELGSSAREVKGKKERTPLSLSFLRKDIKVLHQKDGVPVPPNPSSYGNLCKLR